MQQLFGGVVDRLRAGRSGMSRGSQQGPQALTALDVGTEFAKALTVPEIRRKFEVEALEIRGSSPQALEKLMIREIEKWKVVVKKANLKAAS